MAVDLPQQLRACIQDALAVAFSRGAPLAAFADTAICVLVPVGIPPAAQALLLVHEVCIRHRAGHPEGPLHTLADGLTSASILCGAELLTWLGALPPETDPQESFLVGPWRSILLLDHARVRCTLRSALVGSERVPLVWIPGPLTPKSDGCAELIRQIGVFYNYEVVSAVWSPGIGLQPEHIVREVCWQLGERGELPPQTTTDSGYLRMLAGFVIAAAKQRNHKILLLFDGFCFPECPEQCLQFITWLMLGVNNTESPTAPIRLITLNFNPGPRVPPQLKQIVRTHPESLSWPEIREQCLEVLASIGMTASEAAQRLDPRWADAPDPMDAIHAHMNKILEAARGY